MLVEFEITEDEREAPPSEEQLAELEKLRRLRGEPFVAVATQAEAEAERRRLWAL